MTVGAAPPSVFDADLPTLSYRDDETPAEVYPRLREAQRHAPVALGPHGPEVLGYHMVRSVLRDTRFQIPPGLNLLVQGITSGPLWDKVVNSLLCLEGDAHHRPAHRRPGSVEADGNAERPAEPAAGVRPLGIRRRSGIRV